MSSRTRPTAIVTFMLLILTGCTSTPAASPPKATDDIERRLTAAANTVADSVAKLAIVEQSARGVHAQAITPEQLPADLQLKVSLDYQGDIEPLMKQLARTVGYRMEIYGRRQAITPVHIHADIRAVGLILADADYQSSGRCDVFVIPHKRLIELRYNRQRPKHTRRS